MSRFSNLRFAALAAGAFILSTLPAAAQLLFNSVAVAEFGYVPVGGEASIILQFVNGGTAPVSGTVTTSPPFAITSGATFEIAPSALHSFTVTVEMADPGAFTAPIHVTGAEPLAGIAQATSILPDLEVIADEIAALGYIGASLDSVPDVTGDDRADLVVATLSTSSKTPQSKGISVGRRISIYNGVTGQHIRDILPPESEGLAMFGLGIAGLNDINGDGLGDLAIAGVRTLVQQKGGGQLTDVHFFDGATGGLLRTFTTEAVVDFALVGFGVPLDSTPDLNGDGIGDLIVGAPAEFNDEFVELGRVYVVDPVTAMPIHRLLPPLEDDIFYFGASVGWVPSVNGDAAPDLLIQAVDPAAKGQPTRIQAYIYNGADGQLIHRLLAPTLPNFFVEALFGGKSITGLDDVNGDGAGDVAIIATLDEVEKGASFANTVLVFNGATGSVLYTHQSEAPEGLDSLVFSVDSVGDFNGDGRGDYVVGGATARADLLFGAFAGKVDVVNGDTGGILESFVSHISADNRLVLFGIYALGSEDLSGDGVKDVVTTLYTNDANTLSRLAVFHSSKAAGGVTVAPPRLDFGLVAANSTATGEVRIANNTGIQLQGAITVTGPFTLPGAASYELAPGESEIIQVNFQPTSAQLFDGTLTFTDNQTATVILRGQGVAGTGVVGGLVEAAEDADPLECVTVLIEGMATNEKGEEVAPFQIATIPNVDGSYNVENIPAGPAVVRVFAPGFTPEHEDLIVLPNERVTAQFALEPNTDPINLAGQISESTSGETVGGVQITAVVEGESGDSEFTTFSCVDGAYELSLDNLKAPVRVVVGGGDFGQQQTTVDINPGEMADQDFGLVVDGTPGALMGNVTGAGAVVAGARVTATRGATAYEGVTAGNGAYTIEGLVPGIYSIKVSAEGFPADSKTATVFGGDPATVLNFQLNQNGGGRCSALPGDRPASRTGDAIAVVALLILLVLKRQYVTASPQRHSPRNTLHD